MFQTILAIDTETLGLNPLHKTLPAEPFLISTAKHTNDKLIPSYTQFHVNGFTRRVESTYEQRCSAESFLIDSCKEATFIVFHNARFDIRVLQRFGIDLPNRVPHFWDKVHDTLPMSHVMDSSETHGLKDLAKRYLDFADTDETELKDLVKKMHRFCKSKSGIAAGYDKFILGDVAADYWLPEAIANYALSSKETLTALENKEIDLEKLAESAIQYACNDAMRTAKLFLFYVTTMATEDYLLASKNYERERQLIRIIYEMESSGIPIIKSRLKEELTNYRCVSDKALLDLAKVAPGLNPASPKQLGAKLFNPKKSGGLGYKPVSLTASDQPSTDKDTLTILHERHPKCKILNPLIEYRTYEKAANYLSQYEEKTENDYQRYVSGKDDLRLYTSFNPNGTATTRFSSSNPNAQNVGKGKQDPVTGEKVNSLRCVFGPNVPTRCWLDCDYSNLELRLFALAANEKSLLKAFEKGDDVHDLVRKRLGFPVGDYYRRIAKGVSFGIIYGAKENRIDAVTGIAGTYNKFRGMFPSADRFINETSSVVKRQGYVETLFGYRLYVPRNRPYAGVNYVIQGTAGDILKLAMLESSRVLSPYNQPSQTIAGDYAVPVELIACVHDELIFNVRTDYNTESIQSRIRTALEFPGEYLRTKLPVDISLIPFGKTWADA